MNATVANEYYILIVDDEPNLLSLAETALASRGYRVIAQTSSTEALRLLEEPATRCDLLLTDFEMPDLNGLQLIEKAWQLRPGLPALITSGNPGSKLPEEIARLKLAFLPKPWKVEDLVLAVRSTLGQTGK